ncbi:MAG: hypothetical protein PWR13_625 [Archaeoglobi archaeon]|nr:hypothetical protein [Archaeoglobi archaeon]MDK2781597.1 hypothetical protein [Archaeoglobi archaeon]
MMNLSNEEDVFSILIESKGISLLCTPGKIEMSIERSAKEDLIEHAIMSIASVDSSVSMELEIYCDYDEIEHHAGKGYKIMAYKRVDEKYRVSYSIPFSKDEALRNLIRDVCMMKNDGEFRKTILWEGDIRKIKKIYEILSKRGEWEIKEVLYREEFK